MENQDEKELKSFLEKQKNDTLKEFKSCLMWLAVVIVLGVGTYYLFFADLFKSKKQDSEKNLDKTKKQKEEAYFTLKHAIINNLKDPDSYETITYGVTENLAEHCYNVNIAYRAKNSFGGMVTEQVRGKVKENDQGKMEIIEILPIE